MAWITEPKNSSTSPEDHPENYCGWAPGVHRPAAEGHRCAADGYEEGGTPSREEVQDKLETLRMEREDVRPAAPEPLPFVVGDLVHIRSEFRGAFGIDVPMRAPAADQIPRGWSPLGCCLQFRPCKGQTYFNVHPHYNLDARMSPGSRVHGPKWKVRRGLSSEPAGFW